jgi:hypothetical protein
MQLNKRRIEGGRFTAKIKTIPAAIVVLVISLVAAACGDNTATSTPPTVAATTAATSAAATTAALTSAAATTTALTTGAATSAASTTSSVTTAAVTTAPVVSSNATASATTATATTAAAPGSAGVGQAKVSLANTTVQAGSTVDVDGDGFPTNSWVTIQFGPGATTRQVASLALTDATGKFKVPLILSTYGDGSKIEPGNNIIQAITQDGKVSATTMFTIVPAPATATPKA